MADGNREPDSALQSAVGRLRLAAFVVEGGRVLRPMNPAAEEIFASERFRWDLIGSDPGHPLSKLVRRLLEARPDEQVQSETLELASGSRYRVEPSRRSEKGRERPLMLLLQRIDDSADHDRSFAEWGLTAREQDVARRLISGASSEEICDRSGFAASTLKTHLRNILSKSNSRSRTEFLSKLMQRKS